MTGALFVAACGDDGGESTSTTDEPTLSGDVTGDRTGSGDTGGEILLDDGRIVIPEEDVGDVDLSQLPLGVQKISEAPEQGFVYLCPGAPEGMPGAHVDGPWISGETYSLLDKYWVPGDVDWPEATFDISVDGETRVVTGNNLPINAQTGTYPIPPDSEAYTIDRNSNSISAQELSIELPANPVELAEPSRIGGEVGVLLTGVVLFNAFDAGNQDAVAREVQDKCQATRRCRVCTTTTRRGSSRTSSVATGAKPPSPARRWAAAAKHSRRRAEFLTFGVANPRMTRVCDAKGLGQGSRMTASGSTSSRRPL